MILYPLNGLIGHVTLIDSMGTDITVVNAARVSFAKESGYADGYGKMKEGDIRLIKYLAKHEHWTPFSQPQVQLRIKMPLFVARQWYKHQVGFTRNEVSRRYVSDTPECYIPSVWRKASPNIKQGSLPEEVNFSRDLVQNAVDSAVELYEYLIKSGVCAEQARTVLPQSMFTEFVEVGSLAAYARLYSLRSSEDAQKETRDYANSVGVILRALFPHSWAALTEAAQV
jgi:thymidylate synthase (FAD)